jgi:hypothetical protein
MPTPEEFEKLVADEAAKQKANQEQHAASLEHRRKWWPAQVKALLDQVQGWLTPLIEGGSLTFERREVIGQEEILGRYTILSARIKLGSKEMIIEPAASMIFLDPEEVLDWYDLCSGALALQQIEIRQQLAAQQPPPNYLPDDLWFAPEAEIENYFKECQEELDLAAVFALIASAEARIRVDALARATQPTDEVGKRVGVLLGKFDQSWRIPLYEDGIMEAWKGQVAACAQGERAHILTAIGKLKELLPLRHWVAHGRYFELSRSVSSYPPSTVANYIDGLYAALGKVSGQQAGMTPFR